MKTDWRKEAIEGKESGALKGRTMYLSHPMQYQDTKRPGWELPVIDTLTNRFGIAVHDPGKDEKQKRAKELDVAIETSDFDTVEEIATCFVKADLARIDRCDFLCVYNPVGVCATGSPCELHHAVALKKPVMIVCPEGKKSASKWYWGYVRHRYIFGSWDELYVYLDDVDKYKEYKNHRWWVVYGMV